MAILRTLGACTAFCFSVSCYAVKAIPVESDRQNTAPTVEQLEAPLGALPVAAAVVSRQQALGYGGGSVYYPVTDGRFAAIVVAPGFTGYQSSLAWLGPRLASHGFVVMVIDTSTTADMPDQRAKQLISALQQLSKLNGDKRSPLFGKADMRRVGVMGHSMGGGGAIIASRDNSNLKASLALTPWSMEKQFSTAVPTLIVACQRDVIAPNASYSVPLYNALPDGTHKAYVELKDQTHFCPQSPVNHPLMGRYAIAWMKRFLDDDTRYSSFLCDAGQPVAASDERISTARNNCPF